MEVAAKLKGARISAQKARLVADQVRGMPVEEALSLLEFSSKKAAHIVKKVLDSARLDSHNKFSFTLDSLKLGLYTFKHGAEFQYLYLEPKDSLLMYLNTWDFDESLIFSGKGSAKNNFLIKLYLDQERLRKVFIEIIN